MRWLRKPAGDSLAVTMSGIKLGDGLVAIGSSDTNLVAALAIKAGLTGRACMVDEPEQDLTRAAADIEREGALVESFSAPLTSLPFAPESFDVAILRNVLGASDMARRTSILSEVHRVVRGGGRCVVIEGGPRSGLAGLFRSGSAAGEAEADKAGGAPSLLPAAGFRGVRVLAEAEGLIFVEGVKPAVR
jgi:ubiquinone/menaquinone biosynthesis C-methylase UbiE